MFTINQLKVLKSVDDGCDTPSEVSKATGISIAQTYRIVNDLMKRDLIRKDAKLSVSRNPLSVRLVRLLGSAPDVNRPLSSNGAEILASLDRPRTVREMCILYGFEPSRTYTKMNELLRRSMVVKGGSRYSVNDKVWPELVPFLEEYRRYLELNPEDIPAAAVLYHNGKDDRVFRCSDPRGKELTAFSLYGEFGIDIVTDGFYCHTRREDPTPDSVFRDSLYVISKERNWRLNMFALIFYCKYRDRIAVPEMPVIDDFNKVLDGKTVDGWAPLKEMQERASMYGVVLS